MGRVISGTSGASASTSGSAGSLFNLTAGEDIAANNLILAGENGVAYKANPLLSLAQLNNNTAGLGTVAAFTNLGDNTNYGLGDRYQRSIVTFPTGEIVCAYSGNGTASNYNVNIKIKNITAQDKLPTITISTASVSVNAIGVEILNSSTFVVWWLENVTLKFAIYGKDGSVVKAVTAGPTANANGRDVAMCRGLPNGDFVFFYRAADGSARFSRYNSAGTLQGAEVTVRAGAISTSKVGVIPLSAGGFVCQYWKGDTGAWEFARYTSAGVIVGAVVAAPNSTSAPGSANYDQQGCELSDGTLALLRRGTSNNWFVDLYSSTNTLLRSIDLGANTATGTSGAIIKTAYGFATFFGADANVYCRRFLTSGDQIGLEVTRSGIGTYFLSSDVYTNSIAVENVAAGFVLLKTGSNNSGYDQSLVVLAADFTQIGSVVITKSASTDGLYGACLAVLGNLAIVGLRRTSPTIESPKVAVYNTSRTSIFGVAQASVSKDSAVSIATQGSFTLTDTYLSGGSFDIRTNSAPGNRGTLAGSSVLLLGTTV